MRRPASPSSPSSPLRGSLDTSDEAVGTNPVLRGPPQSSCHSRGVDLFVIDDSKQLNPSRNGPRPVVGVDGAHIPGSAAPGKRGRRGGRPDHRPARNELHAPADAGRPHTGRTRRRGSRDVHRAGRDARQGHASPRRLGPAGSTGATPASAPAPRSPSSSWAWAARGWSCTVATAPHRGSAGIS